MANKDLERACEEYYPDMELNGSGNLDYGHVLAEAILKQKKFEYSEKRAELDSEINFVEKVKRLKINIDDVFSNRDIKQELIREYKGYSRLNAKGKEKIDLRDCSDSKIGYAFQNIYYSALNKIDNAFS